MPEFIFSQIENDLKLNMKVASGIDLDGRPYLHHDASASCAGIIVGERMIRHDLEFHSHFPLANRIWL